MIQSFVAALLATSLIVIVGLFLPTMPAVDLGTAVAMAFSTLCVIYIANINDRVWGRRNGAAHCFHVGLLFAICVARYYGIESAPAVLAVGFMTVTILKLCWQASRA